VLFFLSDEAAALEFYSLSLHDALPISHCAASRFHRLTTAELRLGSTSIRDPRGPVHGGAPVRRPSQAGVAEGAARRLAACGRKRSEEHTSELQSRENLVCRLLLEKNKK